MKKVRISYTADFNEIPLEISNILQKSVDKNEEVNVFIKAAQKKVLSEDINSSFNDVNSAKEGLLRSIIVLEDTLEILQGYGRTLQQLVEEVAHEPGQSGPPVTEFSEGEEGKEVDE